MATVLCSEDEERWEVCWGHPEASVGAQLGRVPPGNPRTHFLLGTLEVAPVPHRHLPWHPRDTAPL